MESVANLSECSFSASAHSEFLKKHLNIRNTAKDCMANSSNADFRISNVKRIIYAVITNKIGV